MVIAGALMVVAWQVFKQMQKPMPAGLLQQFHLIYKQQLQRHWFLVAGFWAVCAAVGLLVHPQAYLLTSSGLPGLFVLAYGWHHHQVEKQLLGCGVPAPVSRKYLVSKGLQLAAFLITGAAVLLVVRSFNSISKPILAQ